MTCATFTVEPDKKFAKKMFPSKALQVFSRSRSPLYTSVFEIYKNKLTKLIDKIPDRKCLAWKALVKVCVSLNIEIPGKTAPGKDVEGLAELLAVLRATDMVARPS